MTLTPKQVKEFEKALAATSATLTKLQFLEKLAEASPELRERVETLKSQHQYLETLATLALELHEAERTGEE